MIKKISQLNAFQFTVIGILAIIASFSLWSLVRADGTEISMCVKQSGVSYVIGTGFAKQECASNEQLLTFNIQGPQGPQGIQGPIGPQGPEGGSVKVYDANDEIVGYVMNAQLENQDPSMDYYYVVDKNLNVIEKIRNGACCGQSEGNTTDIIDPLTYLDSPLLYFEGPNCTGQAYADALPYKYTFSLFGSGGGSPGASTGILVVDHTVPTSDQINYLSKSFTIVFTALENCVQETGTIFTPSPVKNVQDILDSYVRPFRIGL